MITASLTLSTPSLLFTSIVSLSVPLTLFILRVYKWRRSILRLRAQGLPMPPYNIFLGHIGLTARISFSLPSDVHPHYLIDQIRRRYPDLGPNYYLDLYPMGPSMLVLRSPDTLFQVTQEHSLPKYPALRKFLTPLTNGLDIVTMEGPEWKKWRKIFNPGFSIGHLMTLVPAIVGEAETFCSILEMYASSGSMFRMKKLTDNLTMDVIGRVVLDTHLDCQRRKNTLVEGIRTQIRWLSFGAEPNLWNRYHPMRPFVHWYYSHYVNEYVTKELEHRLEVHRSQGSAVKTKETRTIIDLALRTYLDETDSTKQLSGDTKLDPVFKDICSAQIKLFLFSGHDTTSSSILFAIYLLSTNREVLKRVQHEHASVITRDPSKTAERISTNPNLLNQLPLTTAVIKESLRLFPVVTSTRIGEPGFSVTDAQGRRFPTEGFLVWSNAHAVQRDPELWPSAEQFLPDRWLTEPGDPMHPVKGAWRAFEHGPRNCIGQELAMIEMKIVLCLVVRRFEVRDCYEELDRKHATKGKKTRKRDVEGERAYQVQLSQPEGDFPCRVKLLA